jgi:hypothetical protein
VPVDEYIALAMSLPEASARTIESAGAADLGDDD